MIAVDTSALMAIVLAEPQADACIAALKSENELLISAGTVAEALLVASRRNVSAQVASLIDGLDFTVVTVTLASARRMADAHLRWGKGRHPAALNFGDCFSYEVAKSNACPLLFVGNDFKLTDVESVL
jgi:ribonuclease VapC